MHRRHVTEILRRVRSVADEALRADVSCLGTRGVSHHGDDIRRSRTELEVCRVGLSGRIFELRYGSGFMGMVRRQRKLHGVGVGTGLRREV